MKGKNAWAAIKANADAARRDGPRTSPRSVLGQRDLAALQAPDLRRPSQGGPSVQARRPKLRRPLYARGVVRLYRDHESEKPVRNIDAYYNTRSIYDDLTAVYGHPLTLLGIDVWRALATIESLRSLVFVSMLKRQARVMSWGQPVVDQTYVAGVEFFEAEQNVTLDPAAATEENTPLRHEGQDYKHVAALLFGALYRHGAVRKTPHSGGKFEDAGATLAAERAPARGKYTPIVMDGARLASLAMLYALIADAVPEECLDQVSCLYGGQAMQRVVHWVVDRAESDAELELAAKLVERFPIYANLNVHYGDINAQFNKDMDKFFKEIDAGTVQGDKATIQFLSPSDSTLLEDPITINGLKKLRRMKISSDACERSTLYPVFDKAVELVYGMTAKMLSRKLKRPIFKPTGHKGKAPGCRDWLFSLQNFMSLIIALHGWDQSVYMGLNYSITYISTAGRRPAASGPFPRRSRPKDPFVVRRKKRTIVIEKPEVSEA